MTEKEIWKDVPGYEGYYQVSDLGRARSLDRIVIDSRGGKRFYRGVALKTVLSSGYHRVSFRINGSVRHFRLSQLVAIAFLDHKPDGHKKVVDHINGIRTDDRLSNLRIVTQRANLSTCFRSNDDSFSSKYPGVYKDGEKWVARIRYSDCKIYLGRFTDELEASNAYQSALSKIKDGSFNAGDYKIKFSSKYKGVSFRKSDSRWTAQTTINGKKKNIGSYKTEIEAHEAYKQYKQIKL